MNRAIVLATGIVLGLSLGLALRVPEARWTETTKIRAKERKKRAMSPGALKSTHMIWRKFANVVEQEIYEVLGPHKRILPYLGVDPDTNSILLPRLGKGDLWTYLATHNDIPLNTRITWAIEIAQGLAHLHARQVVWADAHLRNILLTDDFHMVLCDFSFSVQNPPYFFIFPTAPPPVFTCPQGYFGRPPWHVDIFGFGVIFYVLLANRFPFCLNLLPPMEEQVAAYENHCSQTFDRLTDSSLDSHFGRIVADCFAVRFEAGDELLRALEGAYKSWAGAHREEDLKGDSVDDTPYPEKPEFMEIEPVPPIPKFPTSEYDTGSDISRKILLASAAKDALY